ncbi:M14 metallopeptidase family protein [Streptomyces lunalinharesii]
MEWTTYHPLADIYGYMDHVAAAYPSIARETVIGKSVEGRPLKTITIGDPADKKPGIVLVCGQHGREWISPATCTYLMSYITEGRRASALKDRTVTIVPVANPDGYEYTFQYDRLWRKNRRKGPRCAGVDLNRNWGYKWGGKGTSRNMCQETYPGTKAFSEPETAALKNYFETLKTKPAAVLDIHSYGQYILYPWGYDKVLSPDYKEMDRVGRLMADKIKKEFQTEYSVGNSAILLYPAAGGLDDYAKAKLRVKYTYTLELGDTGKYGFNLPSRYIVPTSKELVAAVTTLDEAISTTQASPQR